MATVASLDIGMRVNSERLNRDLAKARKDLRTFGSRVGRDLSRTFRRAGAALAGFAAGFAALAKRSIDAASEIERMRLTLNVTAEEWQRFAFGLEISDINANTGAEALKNLTRQIEDLRRGTGEAVKNFASLNLTAADFEGKSVLEQFAVVQKAVQRLGEGARGPLTKIFETLSKFGGKAFVADLEAIGDRLERLGGVVTDEQAKNAAAWADEFTTLSAVVKGQFTKGLLSALGPARNMDDLIASVGKRAREFARDVVEVAKTLYEWRRAILAAAGALALIALGSLATSVIGFFGALKGLILGLKGAFVAFAGFLALPAAPLAALIAGIVVLGTAGIVLKNVLDDSLGEILTFVGHSYDLVRIYYERQWKSLQLGFVEVVNSGVAFLRAGIEKAVNAFIFSFNVARRKMDDIIGRERRALVEFIDLGDLGEFDTSELRADIDRLTADLERSRASVGKAASDLGGAVLDSLESQWDAVVDFLGGLPKAILARLGLSPDRLDPYAGLTAAAAFGVSGTGNRPAGGQTPAAAEEETQEVAESWVKDFGTNLRSEFSSSLADLNFKDFAKNVLGRLQQALAESLTNRLFDFIGTALSGRGGIAGAIGSVFSTTMHEGGYVPGRPGQEVPILAEAGELVLNARQQQALLSAQAGAPPLTINISATGDVTAATRRAIMSSGREVADIVQQQFRERRVL